MSSSTAATMSALRRRTFFSTSTTGLILQYAASLSQTSSSRLAPIDTCVLNTAWRSSLNSHARNNLLFSAAHAIECIGHPTDHVERVHNPYRIRTATLDQRIYPSGTVCSYDLEAAPLIAGELIEKQAQDIFAISFMGPYQAAPIVVDDDRQVLATLTVRRFVYANTFDSVKSCFSASRFQISISPCAYVADCAAPHVPARRPHLLRSPPSDMLSSLRSRC